MDQRERVSVDGDQVVIKPVEDSATYYLTAKSHPHWGCRPLLHEDEDMVDIFLDLPADPSTPICISDHGLTLMRVSYSYDIDTPKNEKSTVVTRETFHGKQLC